MTKKHRAEKKWRENIPAAGNCTAAENFRKVTLYSSRRLGPGEIPIHLINSTIRKTDIFLFPGWHILCTATSSEKLIAKHPCRNPCD